MISSPDWKYCICAVSLYMYGSGPALFMLLPIHFYCNRFAGSRQCAIVAPDCPITTAKSRAGMHCCTPALLLVQSLLPRFLSASAAAVHRHIAVTPTAPPTAQPMINPIIFIASVIPGYCQSARNPACYAVILQKAASRNSARPYPAESSRPSYPRRASRPFSVLPQHSCRLRCRT